MNKTFDSDAAEQGDENVQIETLKKVIKLLLNGERLPGLLMTIIRFVMPSQNHTIKKLLLIFWEIVPKTTPDGKLLQEMILVCDAYRKVSSIEISFSLLKSCFLHSYFLSKFIFLIVNSFDRRICNIQMSFFVDRLFDSCVN